MIWSQFSGHTCKASYGSTVAGPPHLLSVNFPSESELLLDPLFRELCETKTLLSLLTWLSAVMLHPVILFLPTSIQVLAEPSSSRMP